MKTKLPFTLKAAVFFVLLNTMYSEFETGNFHSKAEYSKWTNYCYLVSYRYRPGTAGARVYVAVIGG